MEPEQRDWLMSAIEDAARHDSLAGDRVLAEVRRALFERDDQAPTTLGRFHILGVIGRGAMGTVHAAYDPKLDRKIALKVLPRGAAEVATRVSREARTAAQLNHPNVVTVHDFGELDGRAWVAMEFVQGRSLREALGELPRPWGEIRPLFVAAAEGLAAAHAAGVVHRDFKPDNVLVGDDGRVRVADFGLAVSTEAFDDAADAQAVPGGGTPAYMAPEQLRGDAIDARADQFSFCVALFEAVHGARPFAGNTIHAVLDAMQAQRIDVPPGSSVPAPVQRAIERGLRRDPLQRHPDMRGLIAALQPRPRRGRTAVALAAGGLLVVAATSAATLSLTGSNVSPCGDAGSEIAAFWSPATKAEIAEPPTWSAPSLGWTIERFDAYASRWAAQSDSSCEATHVTHNQSQADHDLRTRCLDRARLALRAAVKALIGAEPADLSLAYGLVDVLPDLAACEDVARLRLHDTPAAPVDDGRSAQEAKLLEARALKGLGKFQEALALARAVAETAAQAGEHRLQAAALLEVGHVQSELGSPDAIESLEMGLWLAHAAGLRDIQLDAALTLIYADGVDAGRVDSGMRWAAYAQAEVDRSGASTQYRVELRNAHGLLALARGDAAEALARFQQGGELLERSGTTYSAETSERIARAKRALGSYAEAVESATDALEQVEGRFGPNHPNVARCLVELSNAYMSSGQFADQLAALERALEIAVATAGETSPGALAVRMNLGVAYREKGRLAEAEAALERSIEIARGRPETVRLGLGAALNLASVYVERGNLERAEGLLRATQAEAEQNELGLPELEGMLVSNLGTVLQRQGKYEEARGLHRRALELGRELYGPRHPELAVLLFNLAGTEAELGASATAIELYEQALSILSDEPSTPAGQKIEVTVGLGRALRTVGRHGDAITVLTAALDGLDDADTPRGLAGLLRFEAARVLALQLAPTRALELANQARADLEAAGEDTAEIDAWLAANQ